MIVRNLSLAFGLIVSIVASQLPEYAQQYRQRLGGAIDELRAIVEQFDADAQNMGTNRNEALNRLYQNTDPFVRQRGQRMSETIAREQRLERQQANFATAGNFGRLTVLAQDFDPGIARRAYETFEPALPVTWEGVIAAAVGFLGGLGLFRAAAVPFRRARRPRHNPQPG